MKESAPVFAFLLVQDLNKLWVEVQLLLRTSYAGTQAMGAIPIMKTWASRINHDCEDAVETLP
ncbi:hypothetical protein HPP92_022345 [Vanilla planifolia]|uniref:Uncharacterized protein n=1 Tax=Vanilla planifolia TaxID=51239 RepID=A0A835UF07_VANPL|nr:hypothetical protein HPP92_022345 [Vanilla planifolia]